LTKFKSESQISLKERVEYLTQAIVALNSSSKLSVKDEISELNDKKDVALLQEKIYEELCRMEPITEQIQEAIIQLDSQLYDITKVTI
jgi:nuclear pore complex protein Nup155